MLQFLMNDRRGQKSMKVVVSLLHFHFSHCFSFLMLAKVFLSNFYNLDCFCCEIVYLFHEREVQITIKHCRRCCRFVDLKLP